MENNVQVKSEKGAFQDRPRLYYIKTALIVYISVSYKEHKKQQKNTVFTVPFADAHVIVDCRLTVG